MHLTKETPNGNYLSNRKVIDFFLQFLNASNTPLNVYRHGPCATAVFGSKYDPKNEVLPDEDHDHAQDQPNKRRRTLATKYGCFYKTKALANGRND